MAHALTFRDNGSVEFAFAKDDLNYPWHGLGKQVPRDLTPEQMMEAAQLDWEVEKQPLYRQSKTKEGRDFEIVDNFALVRKDNNKILDYVSDSWTPLQNAEAFGFFHNFVMEADMEMDTAGSIYGGRTMWVLAKIKNSFSVFGKDEVETYLAFVNPHQFGKSVAAFQTNCRIVCRNTLTFALNTATNSQILRMTHRTEFNPEIVKETLGIVSEKQKKLKEAAEHLATKMYDDEKLREFMKKIFPHNGSTVELSRNARKAIGIIEQQPGAELFPGTWWNVVNSVTFLNTHDLGRSAEGRFNSQMFGSAQTTNVKALNLALEMTS